METNLQVSEGKGRTLPLQVGGAGDLNHGPETGKRDP